MQIHHYTLPGYDGHGNSYIAAFRTQPPNKVTEIRKWCYNTYGEPGYRVDSAEIRWQDGVSRGEVLFNREGDLMMFLLRWG